MEAVALIEGAVRPFSQLRIVHGLTPRCSARARWESPSSVRRRRMCSPRVRGLTSVPLGFNALSATGRNGKKATPPCPCGYLGHHSGRCRCTPDQIGRYRNRISGPLLDRIDLHVEVPALRDSEPGGAPPGESSAAVRRRVQEARARQLARQGKCNALLEGGEIERQCELDATARTLLREASNRLAVSARAFHRVLKVSATIADLAANELVRSTHVAEALAYRQGDRYRGQ